MAGLPLWGVASAVLALVAGALVMLAVELPPAWIWWSACAALTLPVLVWFAGGPTFEQLPLIIAACALLFVVRPLQLFVEWRDLYSYFFPEDAVQSLTLLEGQEVARYVDQRLDEPLKTALARGVGACALFIVLLLVGYRLGIGGRFAGGLARVRTTARSIHPTRAIVVSLTIGLGAQMAVIARAGGPKASLEQASDQAALSDSFALFALSASPSRESSSGRRTGGRARVWSGSALGSQWLPCALSRSSRGRALAYS